MMGRGVFVPRGKAPRVDWSAEMARSEAARREEARITEEAIENAKRMGLPTDPLAQLVERIARLEARVEVLEGRR